MRKHIMLVAALAISFTLSSFLNKNLFANNSPQISEKALALVFGPKLKYVDNNLAAVSDGSQIVGQLANAVLKPISKGVYADKSNEGITIVEIKENEVVYRVATFTDAAGKKQTIKYPASSPLSQSELKYFKSTSH